ncbi:MAG TPA: type II toxin-antitoxin system ParD family antitoxin [Planctomycetaceae bacterium]
MSLTLSPETERLLRDVMARGAYDSEDELVRQALRLLTERDELVEAVSEGLADADAGRARPLRDVDADLRTRYGIRRDA